MTSKERVRAALSHKAVDRLPADFSATAVELTHIMRHLGVQTEEDMLSALQVDVRYVDAAYIGPALPAEIIGGEQVVSSYWGYKTRLYWNGMDYNGINVTYPLSGEIGIGDIDRHPWPAPDWFDYGAVRRQIDDHPDKAIITGGAGVYQFATFLREASELYMDMAAEPELAHRLFDRFASFELEYYERVLIAGEGRVDILRCYDDYGTQTSMLFSEKMWREFFFDNTKRLAELAHRYGAYYMQHSCGAVRPIIPAMIECGVDALDPVQKVVGLEPEGLKAHFGDRLCLHGGLDTQFLLPGGSADDVRNEVRHFAKVFDCAHGGYILAPSQSFQPDIPVENIAAMYDSKLRLSAALEEP